MSNRLYNARIRLICLGLRDMMARFQHQSTFNQVAAMPHLNNPAARFGAGFLLAAIVLGSPAVRGNGCF